MQIGEWLGLINTISMQFSLPRKKVDKLQALLSTVISNGYCSYRFLAKIAGLVLSCALAVGPISRLLTRQMYFTIATRSTWDSRILPRPCLKSCAFGIPISAVLTDIAFGRSLPLVQLCFPMLVMWVLAGTPQLSMVHLLVVCGQLMILTKARHIASLKLSFMCAFRMLINCGRKKSNYLPIIRPRPELFRLDSSRVQSTRRFIKSVY